MLPPGALPCRCGDDCVLLRPPELCWRELRAPDRFNHAVRDWSAGEASDKTSTLALQVGGWVWGQHPHPVKTNLLPKNQLISEATRSWKGPLRKGIGRYGMKAARIQHGRRPLRSPEAEIKSMGKSWYQIERDTQAMERDC